MKKRGNREEMGENTFKPPSSLIILPNLTRNAVIATKYTTNFKAGPPGEGKIVRDPLPPPPPPLFLFFSFFPLPLSIASSHP